MFRSRFFWKLYASYAALVLLTAAAIGWLVHGRMEDSLGARVEASLADSCSLVAPYAESVFGGGDLETANEHLRAMGRESGLRITIIDPTGVVLADSDEDPQLMDRHLRREEIQNALRDGRGVTRRHSRTIGRSLLYVAHAQRDTEGELSGFVRVSIPLDDIDAQLEEMARRVGAGAVIGCILALLIGVFVARSITAPIAQMTRAAEELSEGNYAVRVADLPADEIGILGETLNRLSEELTRRIAALVGDEEQLRAMLAGMVEGVVAVDAEDRIVFSNEAFRELFGLSGTEARGRRLWEVARVADLDRLLEEAHESSRATRRELNFVSRDRDAILRAQAHAYSGPEHIGVVVVFHDITELRRLEVVRRDFVANVSHELKTPLTSIRGFVETLLTGAIHDEENNVRFLQKIEQNVERLNYLVADLLSLANIESAEHPLPLDDVPVRPLVEHLLVRHEGVVRKKGVTCRLESSAPHLTVRGDAEALTQVIDNLVSNAVTYTPSGGEVVVSLEQEGDSGVLRVRDTGLGIPAEDLDRIFERFYRVDKARSREHGGTGLGLSIVKHLVQAMHGEVSVESVHGEGSCFTVRIPSA